MNLSALATIAFAVFAPGQNSRAPADPLHGPPFVSCKAWAILDAKSGALLYGEKADQPIHMASTTKIMTCHLIVQLAAKNPAILDETVVVSKRADDTIGSSAEIKTGDKIPVCELLFGMMLPSGNDASVAFAEHFGARFEGAEGDSLAKFIAAMNRRAKALGLAETSYVNPHGLTHKDHHSSPRDLGKLAQVALQDPLFAKIVNTPRHQGTALGADGKERKIEWKNTNELLKTEGYFGVKTGTTEAAGACLVSAGRRGEDSLLVVVLGSAGSAARYSDARNLFRWGWLQRGQAK
ncbi:MAG TPA: D-alanyl-D-alanine carboxypeptidase family protein [Planctomycetia bacterium]|nr:D-alanyl-D-alanine carboxypeptidase family protein [Planctomycetia bacterium]